MNEVDSEKFGMYTFELTWTINGDTSLKVTEIVEIDVKTCYFKSQDLSANGIIEAYYKVGSPETTFTLGMWMYNEQGCVPAFVEWEIAVKHGSSPPAFMA